MDLRTEPGFLNTGASMLADLTLLGYILLLVPAMIVGFVFARRKMFEPYHKLTMTTITIVNWLLIIFLMAVSYSDYVAPELSDNLSSRFYFIPTIHLLFGATAQILATYLVIRMWFEKQLPASLKVKNIKRLMRITLACWLITAALGVVLYFTWYDTQAASPPIPDTDIPLEESVPTPDATDEALLPAQTEEP